MELKFVRWHPSQSMKEISFCKPEHSNFAFFGILDRSSDIMNQKLGLQVTLILVLCGFNIHYFFKFVISRMVYFRYSKGSDTLIH